MTSARAISRGALLVALMAGSSALASGAAYADVLGGTGTAPLPAPLPTVPLLTEVAPSPSPSPSPSETTAPAPAPADQPSGDTTATAAPATTDSSATTTSTTDSTVAAPTTTDEIAANSASAPAPAAAPAPATAPAPDATTTDSSRSTGSQPARVGAPVTSGTTRPAVAPIAGAPAVSTPHAAARLDLADGPATSDLGSFSGFPQLTAGTLQLPGLPQLPGLRPMIAPGQSSQLAPLLAGGRAAGGPSGVGLPLVRTGHSAPIAPGSTGVVLFVMASAAGAAGMARVRIYRKQVVNR